MKQRQFKQSYNQMIPHAFNNDTNAILIIGFLREFGLGITKDMRKASLWYYIGIKQNIYNKRLIFYGLHAYNKDKYNLSAKYFRLSNELKYIT